MSVICPICNGGDSGEFWPRVWKATGKTVRICSVCRSYFQWPLNTSEQQAEFDRTYDAYIADRAAEVRISADSNFDDLVEDSIEERMADIGLWFSGVKSVLEIGAEKGGFLDRLRSDCEQLVGVDACPAYTEHLASKGFEAYTYLEGVPSDRLFDRVCFFSLLEHIADPVSFLKLAASHLNDVGVIVLEVPLASDPLISLYDLAAFKDFYFQAMHPYVYSIDALTYLLERAGLKISQVRYKQRYGLSNHLKWLKDGKPGGLALFSELFSGEADKEYREALEKSGHTDTIYIYAQKF